MNNKTILQTPVGLNLYAIEKERKTFLKDIVIYNKNGVLIETNRGWFGDRYGNNYIKTLEIPTEVRRVKKNGIEKAKKSCKCFYVIGSEEAFGNATLYLYAPSVGYELIYMGIDPADTSQVVIQYKLNEVKSDYIKSDTKFYVVIGLTDIKTRSAWCNASGIAKRLWELSYSDKNMRQIQALYMRLGEAIENAKEVERFNKQIIKECLRNESLPADFITATCRDKDTNEEMHNTNLMLYDSKID